MELEFEALCPKCLDSETFEERVSGTTKVTVDEDFFRGKTVRCPKGHDFLAVTSTPRYAFLAEQAGISYKEGYYLECYLSLYSAYEFFKQVFISATLLDDNSSIDTINEFIKTIKRSEKIDGAFSYAYFTLFRQPAPKLPEKFITQRNNIVHNGFFPCATDCIKLGDAVFKFIIETNNRLHTLNETSATFPKILAYCALQSDYLLRKNGIDTNLSPHDKYIVMGYSMNLISPNRIVETPHDHMFEEMINYNNFILNRESLNV